VAATSILAIARVAEFFEHRIRNTVCSVTDNSVWEIPDASHHRNHEQPDLASFEHNP